MNNIVAGEESNSSRKVAVSWAENEVTSYVMSFKR